MRTQWVVHGIVCGMGLGTSLGYLFHLIGVGPWVLVIFLAASISASWRSSELP